MNHAVLNCAVECPAVRECGVLLCCDTRHTLCAHPASLRLFVMSIAAPPTLNSTLGMSMERCVPLYMFCVMFSVDTTSAYVFGYSSSI